MLNDKQTREVERTALTRQEAAADPVPAWESLLREEAATLGETLFEVRDRQVMEVF